MARRASSIADVLLGEAVSGSRSARLRDMVAIASVVANRAAALGVSPEAVVSAPGEFSAFGKALPSGTEAYRDLAEAAWGYVQDVGPVHTGMFYATPAAAHNLPKGLEQVTTTTGHNFFADPKNRAIETAFGYKTPGIAGPLGLPDTAPIPTSRPAQLPGTAPIPTSRPAYAPAPQNMVAGLPAMSTGPVSRGTIAASKPTAADMLGLTRNSVNRPPTTIGTPGIALQADVARSFPAKPEPNRSVVPSRPGQQRISDIATAQVAHAFGKTASQIADSRVANAFAAQPNQSIAYGPMSPDERISQAFAAQAPTATRSAPPAESRIAGAFSALPSLSDVASSVVSSAHAASAMPSAPAAAGVAAAYADPSRAMDTLQPGLSSYKGISTGMTPEQQAIADQVRAEALNTPPAPTLAEQLAAKPVAPAQVLAPALAPPAPVAAPALAAPRAAPPLAPPVSIPSMPIAALQLPALPPAMPVASPVAAPASLGAFPAAPSAPASLTPGDIYGGAVGQAMSKSGNMVSGNGLGVTGVTNQFGVTTGMKGGYQTALSGPLGIDGPLDGPLDQPGIPSAPRSGGLLSGLFGKDFSKEHPNLNMKTGAATLGLAALGSYVAGPLGAVVGGTIGRNLALGQPMTSGLGGLFGTSRSIDTSKVGSILGTNFGPTTSFANPRSGGAFPSAPNRGGIMDSRGSNRSAAGMAGISPAAAGAIGRGQAGLY